MHMNKTNSIITIGRTYGSAGREVGKLLAEEFGLKWYDKDLLKRAAQESGLTPELFQRHDEKNKSSFLYSMVMDVNAMSHSTGIFPDLPLNHKVFLAQFDAIKKIADEGPCVLIGRCADYALEDRKDVVSVFMHATLSDRIRRIAKLYDLTDAQAKQKILKADKERANYYNYYTNKKWSDATGYQLCLDTSALGGVKGTVEMIKQYLLTKENIAL